MITKLSDIITYVRRIIKTPSNAAITDALIIDYINRFWIMDVDARLQLFDLKTKYQFMTSPTVDQYNMPLYNVQIEPAGEIGMYPVYQGFLGPAYISGVSTHFETQKNVFYNMYPKEPQQVQVAAVGNGGTEYTLTLPILSNYTNVPLNPPISGILRGHVDISGIIASGNNEDPPITGDFLTSIPSTSVDSAVFITAINDQGQTMVIQDSGQFFSLNVNEGLLMIPGNAPNGNQPLSGGYGIGKNTVNYITGKINLTFPQSVPAGNAISVSCFFFETGLPRSLLYYNNVITLRAPPSNSYLVELDAYLSPAAFLNTSAALPYAYMGEYIARGAARKLLSDTGDVDQFNFYEPLFREQEMLVWKRSQRQFTSTRTQTIYSQGNNQGSGSNNFGGGTI